MNTILQKRIEEAAGEYYDISLAKKFPSLNEKDVESDIKASFYQGASFALQNQWISVDEALPEEDIPNCFVAYKAMDMVLYSTGSYEKDNKEWYVDGVGFNAEVTHYMPIPSLKGGEK